MTDKVGLRLWRLLRPRAGRDGRSKSTGVTVHAEANPGSYPRGIKITDAQMAAIAPQIKPDKFHDDWNYTVRPATIPALSRKP